MIMDILEAFANDGFEESMADMGLIDMEGRSYAFSKRRGGLIRRDGYKGYRGGVIRYRNTHKGLAAHTKSEHASHGIGSFCRTHPNHRTC